MRIWLNILLFLFLSNQALGNEKNVHVVRAAVDEIQGKYIIPITPKEYNYKTVWRSPNGIACSISLFTRSDGASGAYECITPDKYKAQVVLDCSINTSRETAVYLFFGQIGDAEEVGNFYVWCE